MKITSVVDNPMSGLAIAFVLWGIGWNYSHLILLSGVLFFGASVAHLYIILRG